jgi:hypothetical protein
MDLASLKSPSEYQSERQNAFPTLAALEWFMRRQRPALKTAGALVIINRRLLIVPTAFDAVALAVGAQAAGAAA